jgi:hypothetical protein
MTAVADELTQLRLTGASIRERTHLDPITKRAFEGQVGRRPLSTTLRAPEFPGVGPVDVVVDSPPLLMELKWSYAMRDKVFESAWDAVKLAIVGPRNGVDCLYVATGASESAWKQTEVADLFGEGAFSPHEMWGRALDPHGPNGGDTVGKDLVWGARGNCPIAMPRTLSTAPVLGAAASDYRIRVVRVAAVDDFRGYKNPHGPAQKGPAAKPDG